MEIINGIGAEYNHSLIPKTTYINGMLELLIRINWYTTLPKMATPQTMVGALGGLLRNQPQHYDWYGNAILIMLRFISVSLLI